MMRSLITFFIISLLIGCTAPSTMLLDEYISIKSESSYLQKQAKNLADKVREKIAIGDSLINTLDKAYNDSVTFSSIDYSKQVDEYLTSCDSIEKEVNALEYKFLDHNISFSTFLKKSVHSKHSKSLLKIKKILDDKIESEMESIDEETLSTVKFTLLQHQRLLEAAIKFEELESKLSQWEAQQSEEGKSK